MLKVGLIVGSTRPNRFADIPVPWLVEGASARRDLQLTVLDLRDFQLPFLNEPASPMATGGALLSPKHTPGANVSASSTPSWHWSPSTITVPPQFSRTPSTAR